MKREERPDYCEIHGQKRSRQEKKGGLESSSAPAGSGLCGMESGRERWDPVTLLIKRFSQQPCLNGFGQGLVEDNSMKR